MDVLVDKNDIAGPGTGQSNKSSEIPGKVGDSSSSSSSIGFSEEDSKTHLFKNVGLKTESSYGKEQSSEILELLMPEGTSIKTWKLIKTLSSRILEFDDEMVLVESLVDKENRIYAEQELDVTLFSEVNMKVGMYFKLCYYKRENKMMLEVVYSPGLVLESDFEKTNFKEMFSDLQLKKK
jgi:hypothetical protein